MIPGLGMGIESRIDKLEQHAGVNHCPCRKRSQLQIVYEEGGAEAEGAPGPGVCERCGAELPVTRIVVVYADSPRLRA